ncbi:hypothetical protein LX32DRAFT_729299 [Colletotrichum zoysiae]|uniref:WD domain-containing protein n=1 Tax=Colletotrichum zoysiae TaxID=1216348 RepID=A0AAD9M059_9PEZI|nr:hypothetical protein LX32DRAFT_729299 [Colletotrichum zoysiae]
MATGNPELFPEFEDIDYFGIGIGAEFAVPSSQGVESQSPGGLSISLEPRDKTGDFLNKGNTNSLQFRRSRASSLCSVVADEEAPFRDVIVEENDARQVAQPDDEYPATPVASSSSSLSTTPTYAGPLESYLACPQSQEKQALCLSRDDDGEQPAGSSDPGSLIVSKRSVPGVYRPPSQRPSHFSAVAGTTDPRLGHMMERYLASEEDGEFLEGDVEHMRSEDDNGSTRMIPRLESDIAPPSGEVPFGSNASVPLTTGPSTSSVAPMAGVPDGPIEVGHDGQSPDSGISDMEAEELHHLFKVGSVDVAACCRESAGRSAARTRGLGIPTIGDSVVHDDHSVNLILDPNLTLATGHTDRVPTRHDGAAQWRRASSKSMYNRENKIMRKLLGKVTADSSTDTHHSIAITSAPHFQASYRPSVAQNAVFSAGVPILCLDSSPNHCAAVIAGRHILKTIVFDGLSVNEGIDLRSAITAQSASSKTASSSLTADQLSIRDVKWHSDSIIFTACANGKIFSYDLARISTGGAALDFVQTREDSRQVNSLDINPHRQTTLLSGSQDGMVRYFDIRAPVQSRSGGLTYSPRGAYKCNADGVRQVKWSPKDGFYFACGTESGVILKWDVRKIAQPLLKIPAHDKACASISWHPDGNHLISGGWDSKCAVWDMSKNADKRQKPRWVIYTPAPVSVVAWRPGLWSASAQGKRAAQVAVSYDDGSHKRFGINSVHIWDLARPTMPYKEIDQFGFSPSGLLWQNQDLLWTAGNDGLFNQCDVAFAPKVLDRQPVSSMAFSARGDAVMFLDERPQDRPRPSIIHHHQASVVPPRTSYSSSPTTPMLSISRSDSEEDVVGSFLGPRRRVGRKRRHSLRSVPVLSTTPPSGSGISDDLVLGLEQAMKVTGTYKTQQSMAVGHIPAAARVDIYEYLSSCYLETMDRELPYVVDGPPLNKRVCDIMEKYARAAEHVNQFRLAQTWRILAYSMNLLLARRAQFHLETRLGRFQKRPSIAKAKDIPKIRVPRALDVVVEMNGEETPRKPSAHVPNSVDTRSLGPRSLLSEEIESTSNVATPIARAINGENTEIGDLPSEAQLPQVMESDGFALPPAAHNVPEPKKKEQKPLDYGPRTPNSRRTLRQDSDGSFAQIFSMSESSRQTSGLASSSEAGTSASTRSTTGYPAQLKEQRGAEDKGEYESRIRGKELEDSPEHGALTALHGPGASLPQDSPEEIFMISQTTMASDTATDDPSIKSQLRSLPTTYGDHAPLHIGVSSSSPPKTTPALQRDSTPTILDSDYFPWPEDPSYPHPVADDPDADYSPPLNPYTLINRALDFETRTSALNASAMVLLLKPLVPESVIDPVRATSILRQHHSRLAGMKLFIQAALLRKLCVRGWPEGIPEWGENYTSIFGPAQQGVKGGFMCPNCRKPRELDPSLGDKALWKCERCRATMAPCAVCGHRETTAAALSLADGIGGAQLADPIMSTWWYCPGCAHGGHTTCLQDWHAPSDDGTYKLSDGCCPLDGCGHACLPGKWREEKSVARSDELGRMAMEKVRVGGNGGAATGGGAGAGGGGGKSGAPSPVLPPNVRGDSVEVPQSRAVESVREALASAAPTAGILSSSPGSRSGERERRKSVKFVPTER